MALDVTSLVHAVAAHALASGYFERVNMHEPLNAPGNGLSAAVWVESITPVRSSGLASTSGRVELAVRIYSHVIQQPQDQIDPRVTEVTDALLAAYSGDFTLGDTIRCVDLLGQGGAPLSAQSGYVTQDAQLFRIMTITLPLLINDLWDQAP